LTPIATFGHGRNGLNNGRHSGDTSGGMIVIEVAIIETLIVIPAKAGI
jgi:hypothetical protein